MTVLLAYVQKNQYIKLSSDIMTKFVTSQNPLLIELYLDYHVSHMPITYFCR